MEARGSRGLRSFPQDRDHFAFEVQVVSVKAGGVSGAVSWRKNRPAALDKSCDGGKLLARGGISGGGIRKPPCAFAALGHDAGSQIGGGKMRDYSFAMSIALGLLALEPLARAVEPSILREVRFVLPGADLKTHCKREDFCFSEPFPELPRIELGASEDVGDYDLRILASREDIALVIEQQFVNTLVIWDEGPRHYLHRWKEYVSPWIKLKPVKDHQLDLLPTAHPEGTRFVPYEKTELYDAFLRSGGKRWANLLPLEYRPASAPKDRAYEGAGFSEPAVTTAVIRVRISAKIGSRLRKLLTIEVSNPRGHS